jgi:hypothetical protein
VPPMARHHALFVSALLAGCGSNNNAPVDAKIDGKAVDATPDAPPDAGPDARPADAETATGAHHHYVVSKEHIPSTTPEATTFGLDLNGDHVVDNQLGKALASFSSFFNSQAAADTLVDNGTILMLADFESDDFTTETDAGFTLFAGANPMPPACDGSADTTCRHHLTGTGTFDIAATSTHDAPLVGDVVAGTFTGAPGTITIQLPILAAAAQVSLIGGRVQMVGATAAGFTNAIVGGGITMNEINTHVYPAVATAVTAKIATECNVAAGPPACGCTSGSIDADIVSLFDTNHDCTVTTAEVVGNSTIQGIFAPDIMIDGQMVLSVGIGIEAVDGTFTP